MNMMLTKAWRDLRSDPGRTALVLLALVIGLWGVGGMLVSYTILTRDLSRNYLATRPPHAVLRSSDFTRLDLAALRARPEIESAEFRDLSMLRIEARPNEWIPLWLFGVEDFGHARLALLRSELGAAVPPPGGLLIERDGRLVSTLQLGALARVRSGGRIRSLPVSGIVFDPAQAPATQDHFIYAYADAATYASLSGAPPHQRLILRLNGVGSRQEVQAKLQATLDHLASQGVRVSSVDIPGFNEHPHQWQLDTLLLLQGAIGGLALLMGAAMVSQLMAAILARQVRQIGILKAIGASRRQVLGLYLTMVLALGLGAGLVAMPLALASGKAFAAFVAGKLNFDILTREMPPGIHAALVAASLLLPLLAALPALLRGVRMPVQAALADHGIARSALGGPAPAAMVRAPQALVLALRNSLRRKSRLAVTVLTMALGVAIFDTGFNVRQSLQNLLTEFDQSMKHDVQVVLNAPVAPAQALPVFAQVANVARLETWNGGRGELQSRVVAADNGLGVVALPPDTDLFRPRLVQGRWLRSGGTTEVVLNQQAMQRLGNPALGSRQRLDIGGQAYEAELVGVIEELEKAKAYVDQARYDALVNPEHRINSLMFVARDKRYAAVMAMKRDIEAAIAASDLDVLYVMSQAERVKVIYDHLNIVLTTIVLLSLLVLVVSALGMASATGINVRERTREIGVMRAIGATPRMIFRQFVAEGMLVSGLGIGLGLLLAWPLSQLAAVFFGRLMLGDGAALRMAVSGEGLAIVLGATLVFGWAASRLPARGAVRVSTRDALAYE